MIFPQQNTLQQQLAGVRALFQARELDTTRINELTPLIEHFQIRIPFIGGFSSGKSSLLNALLEEPLLSTEVTPETAVAAELRFGKVPRFIGYKGDGQTVAVTRQQIEDNQLQMLLPKGWLAIEMPCAALADIQQLVLVDMPGWGSGVDAHQRVVDDYASRSLAYAVVVSAEEGTLRDSLRRALLELAIEEKPVVLVVTKAHKRPDGDVANVTRQLTDEITQLMGRPPLATSVTSAGKRDVVQLKTALALLQSRAENVFFHSVTQPWRGQLQHAAQLMQVLSGQDFKDAEAIAADIDTFEQKMAEFDQRLQRETESLEERVGPILGAIRIRVDNALSQRLESLTSRALDGVNISDDVIGTARLVVAQALKEEFEPTMQRYLDRLVDALPSKLDFSFQLSNTRTEQRNNDGEFGWKALSTSLAPLLLKIPHPYAKIAAAILPILGIFMDSQANRQRQEVEEARKRERAKSQVREALTQAAGQIEAQLRPAMEAQIQKAKESIAQSIAAERSDIERTLTAKRQALQQGEAEAAAQREKAQTDLIQLQAWLAALPVEGKA